jgi:hypothetical protein
MSGCRLVLIEGIPGSGKSTIARKVQQQLKRQGRGYRLVSEGDPRHPADFESVSCLTPDAFAQLLDQYPGQRSLLQQVSLRREGTVLLSYGVLLQEHGSVIPRSLVETLAQVDVYEQEPEVFSALLRSRWQECAVSDIPSIFECCFLQNPLTKLLARHALPEEAVLEHLLEISRTILPLQPCLFYLERSDVRGSLEQAASERPPQWAEFVIRYLTDGPFGRKHHLKQDLSGVIEFYRFRQELELKLLKKLPFPALVIPDRGSWQQRLDAIAEELVTA